MDGACCYIQTVRDDFSEAENRYTRSKREESGYGMSRRDICIDDCCCEKSATFDAIAKVKGS
jgi:hypothetical protein